MNNNQLEVLINSIDYALKEFADYEIFFYKKTNTINSYFEEEKDNLSEPIQIYGLVNFNMKEVVAKEERRDNNEEIIFKFSLKSLRERNLVDAYDMPIFNSAEWLIKYKDKFCKIEKIDLDSPVSNVFLVFKITCSFYRKK